MVDSTSAAGTSHDTVRIQEGGAGSPAMGSVFANFRQYLMGWGASDRPDLGVDRFRSGLAAPQFNGVVRVRSAAGTDVAAVRRELAGVPWWWWVGPDSPEDTPDVLRHHGGRQLTVMPVMVRPLGDPVAGNDRPDDARVRSGLRVEPVRDGRRLRELVRTYRTSMGIGPGPEAGMVRAESQRGDNADVVRLAAVLDGRVVGTTVLITAHSVAGIFLVHVAEELRRQGIATALTAAALRVGRERGMRVAALVASPAGEPLYRRFGFASVYRYRLFDFPA
ncbi:GNAT family N-acetyltransferase [Streptomyces sp. PU10]|uniref:GNAT family N-acetyltransferase n=1 Tax=Streptomyces TaxID=1883 RepID=UPI00106DE45D|nr:MULTISPECIES: GNAT family N-acetyltransferase [Streptomyces]MBH5129892.1 GNAT family N-acetyltransferase [Streptomyces sp. HB-N217]MDU0251843.1 GNAT family N-acetyltransferase [Streptomyces sp. PU10]QKW65371.1 GNAT family N-acetyltransferase [Streptomyces sp. NA03103]